MFFPPQPVFLAVISTLQVIFAGGWLKCKILTSLDSINLLVQVLVQALVRMMTSPNLDVSFFFFLFYKS